jgi:hypothetical protein
MKVFLASCASEPSASPVVEAFRTIAQTHGVQGHELTQDPAAADCILFVDLHLCNDPLLRPLLSHPLTRTYGSKVLVYDERDRPWCALPGVYVSMPRRHFDPRQQRAYSYYTMPAGTQADPSVPTDLLFSFVGAPGGPDSGGYAVRQTLLGLRHDRAVLEDSSGFTFYSDRGDPVAFRKRQMRYIDLLQRSKFFLCPRGYGTSSIRLYETLRAGRVPVIFADEWVASDGPDWDKFTIRIAERDAGKVASILEANEQRWPELSAAAAAAYAEWFGPKSTLRRIFDHCESLIAQPVPRSSKWRDPQYRRICIRHLARRGKNFAASTVRSIVRT